MWSRVIAVTVLLAAVLSCGIAPVGAAEIVWAEQIPMDLPLLDGNILEAINLGGPAVASDTGIEFAAGDAAADPPQHSNFFDHLTASWGGPTGAAELVDDPTIAVVVGTGRWVGGGDALPLQLINLTSGMRYRIQLYAGDQRGCCSTRGYYFEDDLGNASPVWTRGGLMCLIGEFTADSDTQDMFMYLDAGSSDPHITGYVLSIAGDPALATNPDPASGDVDIPTDTALSWSAGEFAAEHDVYLGSSYEDVNDATTADATYMGRQAETAYTPDALTLGATYYWRIDEVNAAPDSTVFKGDIWNFEAEPVSFTVPIGAVSATASSVDGDTDPNSAVNGVGLNENDEHSVTLGDMWSGAGDDAAPWIQVEFEQLEKLDKVHVWNHNTQTESILGFGIKEALIEYSVDGETWSELGTVTLAQAPGNATYTGEDVSLDMIVAKYVKITGMSNYSVIGLPQKGLAELRFYAVPMRARREIPAAGSTGLDPLIELSWRAGREAVQHEVLTGTAPDALTLVATVDDPAYAAAVDMDSTVYIQINEINDAMDPASWEGQIWEMATAEYVTVDDMESYKSKEGSFVWETWTDGFGDDTNGALLGHNGDHMETDTVYDGSQSLPYYYGDGGAANSEASRDINRDWGQHGIVSLSLMFYGAESNVAGEMYIKVNDTEIATYPVSSDLMIPQWQAWTMDLPAAALGDVQSLAIGVKGGTGVIFIDAIRLYNKASETIVGVTPDDTDLVAHYSFEGDASDVTGNGNDGTLEGGPQFVDGQVGQALDCDGVDDFVSTGKVASQLGIGGNDPRTVSSWVYTRGYANGGIYDVGARVAGEDFCLRTLGDVVDQWRIQYWGGDTDFIFNTMERWVNFTHVHDGTHTKIYANGRLIVDWEKTINTTDTNPFQIGCYGWQNDFFYGVIDEVRVYSRPLSQEEALGLAGRTDPIFKEF